MLQRLRPTSSAFSPIIYLALGPDLSEINGPARTLPEFLYLPIFDAASLIIQRCKPLSARVTRFGVINEGTDNYVLSVYGYQSCYDFKGIRGREIGGWGMGGGNSSTSSSEFSAG